MGWLSDAAGSIGSGFQKFTHSPSSAWEGVKNVFAYSNPLGLTMSGVDRLTGGSGTFNSAAMNPYNHLWIGAGAGIAGAPVWAPLAGSAILSQLGRGNLEETMQGAGTAGTGYLAGNLAAGGYGALQRGYGALQNKLNERAASEFATASADAGFMPTSGEGIGLLTPDISPELSGMAQQEMLANATTGAGFSPQYASSTIQGVPDVWAGELPASPSGAVLPGTQNPGGTNMAGGGMGGMSLPALMLLGTGINAYSQYRGADRMADEIENYMDDSTRYMRDPNLIYNSPEYQAAVMAGDRAAAQRGSGRFGPAPRTRNAALASMVGQGITQRQMGLASPAMQAAQARGQQIMGPGQALGNFPMNLAMLDLFRSLYG